MGQDNFRRYLPVHEIRVRVHPKDTFFEVFSRVCAAKSIGCRLTVSLPPKLASEVVQLLESLTEHWAGAIEFVEESDRELADVMRSNQTERVRYAAPNRVPLVVHEASRQSGVHVSRSPVLMEGRVELLWYVREQSISSDYHRYGNLGMRAAEERAEVL